MPCDFHITALLICVVALRRSDTVCCMPHRRSWFARDRRWNLHCAAMFRSVARQAASSVVYSDEDVVLSATAPRITDVEGPLIHHSFLMPNPWRISLALDHLIEARVGTPHQTESQVLSLERLVPAHGCSTLCPVAPGLQTRGVGDALATKCVAEYCPEVHAASTQTEAEVAEDDLDSPEFSKRQVQLIIEEVAASTRQKCEQMMDDRWEAKLAKARKEWEDCRRAAAVDSGTLQTGMRIITKNLRDTAKNGLTGVLLKFDDDAIRWQVKLDSEEKPLKIKPLNLERIQGSKANDDSIRPACRASSSLHPASHEGVRDAICASNPVHRIQSNLSGGQG